MPANVESMAYYGQVPWHGLGTTVGKGVTADVMIHAAGLDWEVEKRPARGARMNKKGVASRYEIVRMPRPHKKEQEVLLGVVGKRYEPLQNREAFKFFDPIVGDDRAYYETAGSLGQGERVWVMARMPGAIEVVRGDKCWKYLLLSNSHTGDGSVMVKFTAIRVVCQNTLMMATEDGQKAVRVRHSKLMPDKLQGLSDLIATAQEVFLDAEKLFRKMVAYQVGKEIFEKYIGAIFPRSDKQKAKGVWPARWHHIYGIFENGRDLFAPHIGGTLWVAYNAVTQFEDYRQPKDEGEDRRLERAWFGSSADMKMKAFSEAKKLVTT